MPTTFKVTLGGLKTKQNRGGLLAHAIGGALGIKRPGGGVVVGKGRKGLVTGDLRSRLGGGAGKKAQLDLRSTLRSPATSTTSPASRGLVKGLRLGGVGKGKGRKLLVQPHQAYQQESQGIEGQWGHDKFFETQYDEDDEDVRNTFRSGAHWGGGGGGGAGSQAQGGRLWDAGKKKSALGGGGKPGVFGGGGAGGSGMKKGRGTFTY